MIIARQSVYTETQMSELVRILVFVSFMICARSQVEELIKIVAPKFHATDQGLNIYLQTSALNAATYIGVKHKGVVNYAYVEQNKRFDGGVSIKLGNPSSEKNLQVTFFRDGGLKCSSSVIRIQPPARRCYAFIQLDKPIYKPGDTVQYRLLFLKNFATPCNINSLETYLVNPNETTIEPKKNYNKDNSDASKLLTQTGLVSDTFDLAASAVLGKWRLEIKVNGKLKEYKFFMVDEYVLPLYEVVLEVPAKISFNEGIVKIKTGAKYAFGKDVLGRANISVFLIDDNKRILTTREVNLKTTEEISFNLESDLGIHQIVKNPTIIKFDVEFQDDNAIMTKHVSTSVEVYSERKCKIEVIDKRSVNSKYVIKVIVRDFDGNLMRKSRENIIASLEGRIIGKTLVDSMATFDFDGRIQAQNAEIKFTHSNCEELVIVPAQLVMPDELYATPSTLMPEISKNVFVTLSYSGRLTSCFYIIINRFGIIEYKSIDCNSKFFIKPTEVMKPNSTVWIFGTDSSKQVLKKASFNMQFEDLSKNKIQTKFSTNIAKPGQQVSVTVTTKNQSYVGLLAFDKKLTYLAKGNDFSKEDFFDKTFSYYDPMLHIKEYKVRDLAFNLCNEDEKKFFRTIQEIQRNRTKHNEPRPYVSRRDSGHPIDEGITNPPEVPTDLVTVRENFPETWIFDTFKMEESSITLSKTVPDSITTWILSAFSTNEKEGFALANRQELLVTRDFFIETVIPYSAHIDETVTIDVFVFNFLAREANHSTKVTFSGEGNFEIAEFAMDCRQVKKTFTAKSGVEKKELTINAIHGKGTKLPFYVRPLKIGKISFKIEAETLSGGNEDAILKTLHIKEHGIRSFRVEQRPFNYQTKREIPERIVYEGLSCMAIDIFLVGDIVTDAKNFDKKNDMVLPHGCGEQTASEFLKTYLVFNYLSFTNKLSSSEKTHFASMLSTGYQQMISHIKEDGSYKTFYVQQGGEWSRTSGTTSVWLTAYMATILSRAMNDNIISRNTVHVGKALEYLKSRQDSSTKAFINDGYSKNPGYTDPANLDSKIYTTSFVLLAFLHSYPMFNTKYDTVIEGGIKFLLDNSHGNSDMYSSITTIYALTLWNKIKSGRVSNGIDTLIPIVNQKGYRLRGDLAHYVECKNNKCTEPRIQVLMSAYMALVYINQEKYEDARPIINWLKGQNFNGNFYESHDTALAMDALTAMGKITAVTPPSFDITLASSSETFSMSIDSLATPIHKEFITNNGFVNITGSGKGFLIINGVCDYYNKNLNRSSDVIGLKVDATFNSNKNTGELTISVKPFAPQKDMIMVEIQLQSGFIFDENSKGGAQFDDTSPVRKVETRKDNTYVILYLQHDLKQDWKKFKVNVIQKVKVKNLKDGFVKAYDFAESKIITSVPFTLDGDLCPKSN